MTSKTFRVPIRVIKFNDDNVVIWGFSSRVVIWPSSGISIGYTGAIIEIYMHAYIYIFA